MLALKTERGAIKEKCFTFSLKQARVPLVATAHLHSPLDPAEDEGRVRTRPDQTGPNRAPAAPSCPSMVAGRSDEEAPFRKKNSEADQAEGKKSARFFREASQVRCHHGHKRPAAAAMAPPPPPLRGTARAAELK